MNDLTIPHAHIPEVPGQSAFFLVSYKGLLKLGDHGHDRSWIGEVRLDLMRLGFIDYLKGPLHLCTETFMAISIF